MLIPSRAKRAAGVLLALAALYGLVKWHDRDVARHALAEQRIATEQARADSAEREARAHAQREAYWHATADSLRVARAADARRLDSLTRRVTITAPGVIAITDGTPHPAPPLVVHVPPVVTATMQAQAQRIDDLERALAVADSGWAAADRVIVAQGASMRPHH
jgi:hypothetical protein